MNVVEHRRGPYTISTDKKRLDHSVIHQFLSQESYWAQGRSMDVVKVTIDQSLCFGIYDGSQQVGFARVVTDGATFAWLADVFVLESHRGQSLGKWLVQCVVDHPNLGDLKWFLLATRDAQEFYQQYGGFETLPASDKWMYRVKRVVESRD